MPKSGVSFGVSTNIDAQVRSGGFFRRCINIVIRSHTYISPPPTRSAVGVIFDGRFKGCMIQVMAKWWTYHVDRLVVACLTSRVIS